MLFISGKNLESSVIEFVDENQNITLFSAYLKINELEKINASKKIKRIIVRWEIQDLCLGVSDLDLYHYCKENEITLYRNTRIHLKAFWNNEDSMIFGSANVTQRGLGEAFNYNFELNGLSQNISFDIIKYLNKIIINSELVTPELYSRLFKKIEDNRIIIPKFEEIIPFEDLSKRFLLSDLPMTKDLNNLYKLSLNPDVLSIEEKNCIAHDLALYNVDTGLNKIEFYRVLGNNFNLHPFIEAFKNHIKTMPSKSLHYGGVVRWLQDNTTTVPIPRSWQIKKDEIVNILYDWVCFFDEEFSWSVPSTRSQVIFYNSPT